MGGDPARRRFIEVAYRVFHEGNPPVLLYGARTSAPSKTGTSGYVTLVDWLPVRGRKIRGWNVAAQDAAACLKYS